jgi:hypothetical protein
MCVAPWVWQMLVMEELKNSTFEKTCASNWEKMLQDLLNCRWSFCTADNGQNEGFEQFSKFKIVQAECSGRPSTSKMDKNMNTERNLFFQIGDSVPTKLLTWEFHLGKFKAFWKTMWTCAALPPNSCANLLTLLWQRTNFWLKTKLPSFHDLPTQQNWCRTTFSFSQNSIWQSTGDLIVSTWFQQNCRINLPSFKPCT